MYQCIFEYWYQVKHAKILIENIAFVDTVYFIILSDIGAYLAALKRIFWAVMVQKIILTVNLWSASFLGTSIRWNYKNLDDNDVLS